MSSDLEKILRIASAFGEDGKIHPVPDSTGFYIHCPVYPGTASAVIGRRFYDGHPSLMCDSGCSEEAMQNALRAKGLWFWDEPEGGKVEIVDGNSTPESRRLLTDSERVEIPAHCFPSGEKKEKKLPDFAIHNHIGTGIDAVLVKKLASAGHRLATAIEALVVELKAMNADSELKTEREAIQTEEKVTAELNQIIDSYTDDGSIPF